MSGINLAEVLEEYAVATPEGNDTRILRSVIEKYPQFDAELMDFAAARAVIKFAPEAEFSANEEKRYQEHGLVNLHRFLKASEPAKAQHILDSLTGAAKAKGLNKKAFASSLGLSVSLLMYLEKRRLEFASIPKSLISGIARVLETGEDLISNYLNVPLELAPTASFKTDTRPEDIKPKNFIDAVREDQTLSAQDKNKLLDLS